MRPVTTCLTNTLAAENEKLFDFIGIFVHLLADAKREHQQNVLKLCTNIHE